MNVLATHRCNGSSGHRIWVLRSGLAIDKVLAADVARFCNVVHIVEALQSTSVDPCQAFTALGAAVGIMPQLKSGVSLQ